MTEVSSNQTISFVFILKQNISRISINKDFVLWYKFIISSAIEWFKNYQEMPTAKQVQVGETRWEWLYSAHAVLAAHSGNDRKTYTFMLHIHNIA